MPLCDRTLQISTSECDVPLQMNDEIRKHFTTTGRQIVDELLNFSGSVVISYKT